MCSCFQMFVKSGRVHTVFANHIDEISMRKLQTGMSCVDWSATFCGNLGCSEYSGQRVNLAP